MKNCSFFFLAIISCFIIGACSNELMEDSSSQTLVGNLEITPYVDNFKKPVLLPYDQYIDTLTQWGFYITAEGKSGVYKQLQYSSDGYNNWKTIEISNYSDIFIEKKGYPYGNAYFRARYINNLNDKDTPSPSYNPSSDISPWSDILQRFNCLLLDGTPLTANDFVVEIKCIFNSLRQRNTITKYKLADFKADLTVKNGTNHENYTIVAQFDMDQPNHCSYSHHYSTSKNSSGARNITFTISNRSSPLHFTFNTITESFEIGSETSITPIKTIIIYVTVND